MNTFKAQSEILKALTTTERRILIEAMEDGRQIIGFGDHGYIFSPEELRISTRDMLGTNIIESQLKASLEAGEILQATDIYRRAGKVRKYVFGNDEQAPPIYVSTEFLKAFEAPILKAIYAETTVIVVLEYEIGTDATIPAGYVIPVKIKD